MKALNMLHITNSSYCFADSKHFAVHSIFDDEFYDINFKANSSVVSHNGD